jgi:hypothetical protein
MWPLLTAEEEEESFYTFYIWNTLGYKENISSRQ